MQKNGAGEDFFEKRLRLEGDEVILDGGVKGGVDDHFGAAFVEIVEELRLVEEVRERDEGLGVQQGDVDGITRYEFRDDEGG